MAFLLGRYCSIATGVGGICGLAATGVCFKGIFEDHRSTPKSTDDCLKQTATDVGNIALAGTVGVFVGFVSGAFWPVTLCSLGLNLYSLQNQQTVQQDEKAQ
jgi:hypothetical protein